MFHQTRRLSPGKLDELVLAAVLNQPLPAPGKTTVEIWVEVAAGLNH